MCLKDGKNESVRKKIHIINITPQDTYRQTNLVRNEKL